MIEELLILLGCIGFVVCSHMIDESLYNKYHIILVMSELVVACIGLIMIMSLIIGIYV